MKLINDYTELNNLSVKISLKGKKYNSTIVDHEGQLYLEVNMTNNIDEWRKIKEDFSIINGKILSNNAEITFVNCSFCGNTFTGGNKSKRVSLAITNFSIDRIIYNKKIACINNKYFSKVIISFKNVSNFFTTKIYEYNVVTNDLKVKIHNDNYNLNDGKHINVDLTATINHGWYDFTVKRNEMISISLTSLMSYEDIINIIYKIKSFLMLMNKKNIYFKNVILCEKTNNIQLIDCYKEQKKEITNSNLDFHIDERCIKYEDIDKFGIIFDNYILNYSKLSDIIEMYYDAVSNRFPNSTRLLNSINMAENMSVEFFDCQALKLTQKLKPKKKSAELVDRIKNLITNVNSVFSFSTSEIDYLSTKIINARTWLVHHKKQGGSFNYDQQLRFYSFIEDLVLLNIYIIIGIDISTIDKYNLIYLDFFYTKKELLK